MVLSNLAVTIHSEFICLFATPTKRRWEYLVIVVAACVMGCSGPFAVSPCGDRIRSEDISMLAGRWRGNDKDIEIAITEKEVVIGALQFDDGRDAFVAVNIKATITKVASYKLLFAQTPDSKQYAFFLIESLSDSKVTLRMPDYDAFERLLKAKRLRGSMIDLAKSIDRRPRLLLDLDAAAFTTVLGEEDINTLFPLSTRISYFRNRSPGETKTEK
jgi:hypothetical protein